jgi:phospholipid/cholesterol/gamma-HCH transport system ATP-binding protein
MAEPLIRMSGVCKTFGETVVLDHADLEIYRGEAVAIIGPSGTGKSTVLRLIAGLLAADAGEIYIGGERRQGLIEDRPASIHIGMVFQQSALFDSLTVEENVGFLLHQKSRLSRQQIRTLVNQRLEWVGLPSSIRDRYPAELSGGMRKRVSFARAIMVNPEYPADTPDVLLYDEPTAGLDPIASTVIEDLVRHLQTGERGCQSHVMVTHQESTIRRTADRVLFLYQGKIRWQGKVHDLETTDNPLIRQFFSGSIAGPIQVLG